MFVRVPTVQACVKIFNSNSPRGTREKHLHFEADVFPRIPKIKQLQIWMKLGVNIVSDGVCRYLNSYDHRSDGFRDMWSPKWAKVALDSTYLGSHLIYGPKN